MKQTKSNEAHNEAWLDTPMRGVPESKLQEAYAKGDPDHLLDVPGVCLKSKEQRSSGGPRYCGKLTSYTDEEVVVISTTASVDHRCIWTGTSAEYRAMWMVD